MSLLLRLRCFLKGFSSLEDDWSRDPRQTLVSDVCVSPPVAPHDDYNYSHMRTSDLPSHLHTGCVRSE